MTVLYEDNHIIIVNKAASEIVQGDKTGDKTLAEMVKEYIKEKYNKPGAVFLGVVHRLDRPVSGVVVFARTSKALERLNAMFREGGRIKKTYWAIVKNRPAEPEAELVHYLVRNEQQNKSYAYASERSGAKRSVLSYRLLGSMDKYHLLEVALQTGRHHQIRAQLSHIGHPILADRKYGSRLKAEGIALCSHSIEFEHPDTNELVRFCYTPHDAGLWTDYADEICNM